MQHLEVSGAVRHIYIYIYIYVIRLLKVNCEISAKAGLLYLCTAQVKIMWIYTFTAHITSSAWCSIKSRNVFCILF